MLALILVLMFVLIVVMVRQYDALDQQYRDQADHDQGERLVRIHQLDRFGDQYEERGGDEEAGAQAGE